MQYGFARNTPAVYLRSEAPGSHYSVGVNFQKQIGIRMTNVVPFSFESQEIRVFSIDGNPWFVAKDVAKALGYANHNDALNRHCKGVVKRYPLQTAGGIQEVRIIAEPDTYRLIASSHLPEAQRFEVWLFEEVLPSIRKTGGYVHPQATSTPTTPNAQEIVDTFHCLLRLAHTCGFAENQALLSADAGTKKLVGTSALALIEATHLHADQRGRTYTPTELGRMLPIRESGKAFNAKLNLCGLQERDDAGCWIPTVKAQGLYEWSDTGKRHSDGVPVKQLKWFVSVLDAAKYRWQRAAA